MKLAFYILALAALILLQGIGLENLAVAGVKPDLALIAVYFIGLLGGEVRGTLVGMILGYLMDLLSGGVWAIQLLAKGIVGFVSGILGKTLVNVTTAFTVGIVILCSMAQGILFLLASLPGFGPHSISFSLTHIILPQAIYDGVLAGAVFWIIMRKAHGKRSTLRRTFKDELLFLSAGRNQRD